MKKLLILVLSVSSLLANAAQWPTGQWQAQILGDIITITLEDVSDTRISVRIDNNPQIQSFRFTDTNQRLAQSTTNPLQSLKLTSYGDMIFQVAGASGKTTSAFLKPVLSKITKLADYPTEQAINDLPSAITWLNYANNDLWKFWGTSDALSYASFRCNNGTLPDLTNLCRELRDGWIMAGINNDYTRMVSRQVYTYGVIFNMTGNTEALEYMHVGLDILMSRYEANGSAATILRDGKAVYAPEQRTAQDLAYVQVGLAMAYYLTGDAAILEKLNDLRTYVINQYYRNDWQMLAWTLSDQFPGDSNNQELVAQLDQLNAYMLLTYPHLPEAQKPEWAIDIRLMVDTLLAKFHLQDSARFAGQIVRGNANRAGERHNDFGHSVKTYWMIYTAGQMLNDENYVDIGRQGIDKIINQAIRFREQPRGYSHWGNQATTDSSSWWEFAELTQATATLALENSDYSRFLPDIYNMWLNNFVDKTYGGVWPSPYGGAKQQLWKNGYHEAEIGLVALITSQKLKGEAVELYFARNTGHFQPYLFDYEAASIATNKENEIVKVTF